MSKYRQLTVESHGLYRERPACEDHAVVGELISANAELIAFVMQSKRDVELQSLDPANAAASAKAAAINTVQHTSPITDLAFAPFAQGLLAGGAQDGTVRLWSTSDSSTDTDAAGVLLQPAGGKAVNQVKWHPSCASLLAVSTSAIASTVPACTVFDVEHGGKSAVASSGGFSGAPAASQSLSWGLDGSVVFLSQPGSKQLLLVDPRTAQPPSSVVMNAHSGTKFLTCEYAGNHQLISCGQNSNRDREVAVWDIRQGSGGTGVLFRSRIDSSQNFLRPTVDVDAQLAYFTGHLDANVRVYDFSSGDGQLSPLGNFTLNGPASSTCLVTAKSALNHSGFEAARLLRLASKSVQQVSVRIPRKPGSAYQDLFPPSTCTSPASATLLVKEYCANRNADPVPVDLFAGAAVDESAPAAASPPPPSATSLTPPQEYDSKRFSKFLGFQAKMKYAKIVQSNKDQSLFGITPGDFPGDANLLAASEHFVAFPWKTMSGGPIFIKSTARGEFEGKHKGEPPVLVQGHGDKVSCIQFSELDQRLLATGAEDATVRVYRLPEGGGGSPCATTQDDADALVQSSLRLQGHRLGVRGVNFHRVCANLLTTFASDETVKLWDLEHGGGGSELVELTGLRSAAGNVDWSYTGNLLAVAGRDSSASVLDPRDSARSVQFAIPQTHDGLKASRVCWLDANTLLTTGFGKTGDRQFRLWDLRSSGSAPPVSTTLLDAGSSVVVPTVVEDNGVVVMAAKGELSVRIYEVEGLSSAAVTSATAAQGGGKYVMHRCSEFRATGEAALGMAFLPRRLVDYKNAEWLSGYRLTSHTVERLSFQVPRSQDVQGYFYDDLFPPCRSGEPAIKSPSQWIKSTATEGEGGPLLMDLNVDKLKVLSQRPAAETHLTIKRGAASVERMKKEQEDRDRLEQEKQQALDRMQRLAVQHEKYNPNLSHSGHNSGGKDQYAVDVGPSDVQDDEWED